MKIEVLILIVLLLSGCSKEHFVETYKVENVKAVYHINENCCLVETSGKVIKIKNFIIVDDNEKPNQIYVDVENNLATIHVHSKYEIYFDK